MTCTMCCMDAELDLSQGKLVGERKILTYGHANNATYAEGPIFIKLTESISY